MGASEPFMEWTIAGRVYALLQLDVLDCYCTISVNSFGVLFSVLQD